jgi:hypothetical protein
VGQGRARAAAGGRVVGDGLAALPERLAEIRSAVSDRYRVDFDSVLVNLYRDGRDGVAWHGDTVRKTLPEAVVVTVGLGERRRFLLRPGTTGPPTVRLETGHGDLVVMGGRTQHEWQHTVPKDTKAGARMSRTPAGTIAAGAGVRKYSARHQGPMWDKWVTWPLSAKNQCSGRSARSARAPACERRG